MFEYKGRQLNISEEFLNEYKKWILIPLSEAAVSSYIKLELKIHHVDGQLPTT